VVQGITGGLGSYFTQEMLRRGTKIVAGVTPGKGGSEVDGVPVYDTLREALRYHQANATVIFVPAPAVKEAIFEAIENEVPLAVCIVEGAPVRDMMLTRKRLEEGRTTLIGPNCPGVISPGKCMVGVMPLEPYRPGTIGIVSRSGTFSYKVADSLTQAGFGQSTCVGIGGDPLRGTSHAQVLEMFEKDPETEAMVLIGEIGGTGEEEAAEYIREHIRKPVVAIILGLAAPPGKPMGHAGAIVMAGRGAYESKVRALEKAGVPVARTAAEVPLLLAQALRGKGG
jgi:succinyl-CoA synthetase alpha subunit